jgi:hypothetical protein
VCDLVHLERRGVPAVGIATAPFADEAVEQADLLAMPDCRMLYIPHPVQLLTREQLDSRADSVFAAVLAALTSAGGSGGRPPGPAAAGRSEISP